jgi:putative NADH-flavin reductase
MIKIIGGSGFIGTRLSKRLSKNGSEFSIVDKAMSKIFETLCSIADVRDTKSLSKVLNSDDIIIWSGNLNLYKEFNRNHTEHIKLHRQGEIDT